MTWSCSRIKHWRYLIMEELMHKFGSYGSGKNNIWNTLQLVLALHFKMLSVASSGLVLICNFFEETYFCHLHAYLLACFYEKHLKFLTSYILSQEMMEQVCDLETVQPQDIPIKVCVVFCNIEICYWGSGEKASFLAIIWFTQINSCRPINGWGAVWFVMLLWEWY